MQLVERFDQARPPRTRPMGTEAKRPIEVPEDDAFHRHKASSYFCAWLQRNLWPERPAATTLHMCRRQGGRGAIDHFALAVDSLASLEVVKQRIVDAGGEVGDMQRLGDECSLCFRDIDGIELEVCVPG